MRGSLIDASRLLRLNASERQETLVEAWNDRGGAELTTALFGLSS